MSGSVEIADYSFWYGRTQAVRDVSLAVSPTRITAFIVDSGLSGKLCAGENYTGTWTACATKRTPKAAQTRLMVSKRGCASGRSA